MQRKVPPITRTSRTRKIKVNNATLYVIVGFYKNNQPCEIFITVAKEGSTLAGCLDSLAISLSLGLQHGVPWAQYAKKFEYTNFIPHDDKYSSLTDALAKEVSDMIKEVGGDIEQGPELKENPAEDDKDDK